MYGGGHDMMMNGNMIEASMIPGSTGMSPSPTVLQQQHHADMYHNNGNILSANAVTSLRTHSSKFPVSIAIVLLMTTHDILSNFINFSYKVFIK